MYQIENWRQFLTLRIKISPKRISPTVLLLGLTSFVSDISAEMVTAVLPLYLVLNLNLSPLVFGIVDGVYVGGSAIFRLLSGYLGDRSRKLKEIALAGYALSAFSRLGLLMAGSNGAGITAVILLDRLGKGIRTAPRDAMISLSGPKEELAVSFGVHRAMDTAGAMLGPLIAFAILILAPGSYDAIFVVSLCFALVGLGVIGLFVQNQPVGEKKSSQQAVSVGAVYRLARSPGIGTLLIAGTALSLASVSDGFLYLVLQRRVDFNVGLFPLLFVATALIYMLFAIPMGLLADRIGRVPVFIGGYAILLFVYALLLLTSMGTAGVFVCLAMMGAYYAATDGVLMAMVSAITPSEMRTTGLALITTAISLARLVASILFGLLWTWQDISTALGIFIGALAGAIILSALVLSRRNHSAPVEED